MDKSNILEENLELDIKTLTLLSKGNPGCLTILLQILKNKNLDYKTALSFFTNINEKQILGARLWYIYKNECNENINKLLSIDLTPFTDEYFYEKYEKYI
jgi:hypothetical protein